MKRVSLCAVFIITLTSFAFIADAEVVDFIYKDDPATPKLDCVIRIPIKEFDSPSPVIHCPFDLEYNEAGCRYQYTRE